MLVFKFLTAPLKDLLWLHCLPLLILLVLCSITFSCSSGKDDIETEVISYFEKQGNPDKLRAARYLLEHMKGHYGLSGPNYDKFLQVLHDIHKLPMQRRSGAITELVTYYKIGYEFFIKKDGESLPAAYLIRHIENAYQVWEKVPWQKDYSFDIFCEYVLPYRIENERYSNWFEKYNAAFHGIFDEIFFSGGSVYKAISFVKDTTRYLTLEDGDSSTLVKLAPGMNAISFDSISIDKDGEKYVRIQYTGGFDSARIRLVLNKRDTIMKTLYPTASLYAYPGKQFRFKLHFQKGINTIDVSSINRNIGIDYIDIIPVEKFYRNDPAFGLVDGASYIIRNVGNGSCLQLKYSAADTLLTHGSYKGLKSQQFNIQNIDYGFFCLSALETMELKKTIEVSNDPGKNYGKLRQGNFSGANNQQWAIIPGGGNSYKIISKSNGKCLGLTGKGGLVEQAVDAGIPAQRWKFERTGSPVIFDSAHVPQNSPLEYACRVKDALNFDWMLLGHYFPSLPGEDMLKTYTGDCREQSHYLLYVLRSLGIPAASDFDLQHPYRDMGHDWNAIIDNKGKTIYYQMGKKPGTGRPDSPAAKIYRRTFRADPASLFYSKAPAEPVPVFFKDPYIKDVTNEYFNTKTISVRLFTGSKISSRKNAYLCVWDNQKWFPVAAGKMDKGMATFKDMGLNALYLPAIFGDDDTIIPAGDPFILTSDGLVQYISPDTARKAPAVLKRKYYWDAKHLDTRMDGGKFQAANKADFSDAVTLYIYKGRTQPIPYTIPVTNAGAYKFLRYVSPRGGYGGLAELEFFNDQGKEVAGRIIGSEGSYKDFGNTKEKVFDKELLTFFDGVSRGVNWVGLELEQPEKISRIRFVPRNDGNCIEVGDEYELMCWNGDTWKSLGRMIAREDSLIYKQCPTGALFLLHDRTKGRQERIFTFSPTGGQVWW
ncbi:RICIN domain-containing protein [Chitinophaga japonensis]|uniref:Ricin-type beta-trefoil lectin protein n=1 Tax=Chitinophaga japonensis TaxID=104662 RepID=A0A562T777_CHIJA|nr:RICIN domain-containing protein [Chitinophaga japonensis]TWI88820.1 ricin-type beta-trefoil lectin protein [Chitinophaga japonensis]